MRGLDRKETLGMIDRSSILEHDIDSDGNPLSNDGQDSDDDVSVKSYDSSQNQYGKSYSFIEFCVKTQIFSKEYALKRASGQE